MINYCVLILFKVRVVTNNGYYMAITMYVCTVAGIIGLATVIHSDSCMRSYFVILYKYCIKTSEEISLARSDWLSFANNCCHNFGNYNIKYLSIINFMCEFITPHKNSPNMSSVSIKKGYKINIEHDIEKLKVASEREFMWVL